MSGYVTSRRVGLHGQSAITWFEQRGWVLAGAARNVTVVADEIRLPSVTVRRVAHSPLALHRNGREGDAGGLLTLVHGGSLRAGAGGSPPLQIEAGATLGFAMRNAVTMAADAPAAWAQVESASLADLGTPRRHAMTSTFELLSATVTAVLGSVKGFPLDAAVFVDHAVEASALAHARSMDAMSPTDAGTYARARAQLVRHGHSPGFSVAQWAEMVGVTREHLARLARAHGVTPTSLLRAHRQAVALRTLALHPEWGDGAVAEASGFRSARSMREALRRATPLPHSPDVP